MISAILLGFFRWVQSHALICYDFVYRGLLIPSIYAASRALQRSSQITAHTRVLMNISSAFENTLLAMKAQRLSVTSMSFDESNVSDDCMRQLLAEYCERYGSMDGIPSPTSLVRRDESGQGNSRKSGSSVRKEAFDHDVDVCLAYLNYRYQVLLYLQEEDAGVTSEVDRSNVSRLLAAVESTSVSKPLLGYREDYSTQMPLLDIDRLLDLYNGNVDVSQLHFGLADPVIAGSLKKIGFSQNIFFQFFVGILLKEECVKLYDAMPALTALLIEKKNKLSKPDTDRVSSSTKCTFPSDIPYYMRDSVLQHMGVGVDVESEILDRATVDDSVFSSSMYYQASLANLIEYSQHHPMMFVTSAPLNDAEWSAAPGGDGESKSRPRESAPQSSRQQKQKTTPTLRLFDQEMIIFNNEHRLQWLASYCEHFFQKTRGRTQSSIFVDTVNSISFEMWHNAVIVIACIAIHFAFAQLLLASIIICLCIMETYVRLMAKGIQRSALFVVFQHGQRCL